MSFLCLVHLSHLLSLVFQTVYFFCFGYWKGQTTVVRWNLLACGVLLFGFVLLLSKLWCEIQFSQMD